jgi:uroporphyrinogen decarboxylase
MIAAMTAMDLTTEAEAFGCNVKFSDTEAPRTTNEVAKDKASVENLKVPSVSSGRGLIFVNAAKLTAEAINDRPTFGGILGPFSLAAVLMGIEPALKALKKDPDTVHMLRINVRIISLNMQPPIRKPACTAYCLPSRQPGFSLQNSAMNFLHIM